MEDKVKKSHAIFTKAYISGVIKKPESCSFCGTKPKSSDIVGHHEDYSKPLDVIWLCKKCHSNKHRDQKGKGVTTNPKYSNVTIPRELNIRIRSVHKNLRPQYSFKGFVDDLLDVYEKFHCVECKNQLSPKTCNCKESEF